MIDYRIETAEMVNNDEIIVPENENMGILISNTILPDKAPRVGLKAK